MTGRFPPGPPLVFGCFPCSSQLGAVPVGSSQVQQGGDGLDPNCYECPPCRPSDSHTTGFRRTGSFKALSLPPDTVHGFSKAVLLNKITNVHDRWLRPATAVVHGLPIKPITIPLGRRGRLLQGRFTEQKD